LMNIGWACSRGQGSATQIHRSPPIRSLGSSRLTLRETGCASSTDTASSRGRNPHRTMAKLLQQRLTAALAVILLQWASLSMAAVFTMSKEPAFEVIRVCAKACVTAPFGSLPEKLDCSYPYQNECVCRVDLAGMASKYLTSCVSRCTAGPVEGDLSTMMSVYNSYCMANGFDVTAAPAFTTPTGTSGTTGKSPCSTVATRSCRLTFIPH
jgi:hypothetical protein